MADSIEIKCNAPGLAALSICESLLIALSDLKIISANEAAAVLTDAASAHRHAVATGPEAALHGEVAAVIEHIIAGRSSMLLP